ncbi:MAG: peptide deformylase [Desulfomonilaceae bacterium]
MSILPIVTVPDEILKTRSLDIKNIDEEICQLAQNMLDTMYKAPGIGLAANQVGKLLNLIVLDVEYAHAEPQNKKKAPLVVVNPTITVGEGEDFREEGCLSVPDFTLEVKRRTHVQVEGVDLNGRPLKIEAEGLLARVLQHEIDHLRGTTLLSHASALKRSLYERKIKKRMRRDR